MYSPVTDISVAWLVHTTPFDVGKEMQFCVCCPWPQAPQLCDIMENTHVGEGSVEGAGEEEGGRGREQLMLTSTTQ